MVHIPAADTHIGEIVGQVLRHAFGQRGHQRALPGFDLSVDGFDQIVDLAIYRADEDLRIQKARRPDDLLRDLAGAELLVFSRCGGDVDPLVNPFFKFIKFQRTVVKSGRKPEAKVHQACLAGPVPVVHGVYLRQGDVAFVHKQNKVLREVVQQRHRRAAGGTVRDYAGVVLNAGAVPDLLHHFNVVLGSLPDALGLDQFSVFGEMLHLLIAFLPDPLDGGCHLFLCGDVMACRIDHRVGKRAETRTRERLDQGDPVDLIPEEFNPDGFVIPVRWEDLQGISANPEVIALKRHVVTLIARLHQLLKDVIDRPCLAWAEGNGHFGKVIRFPEAIDAGDGGHHNHVPPLQEGEGSGKAEPVDLIVDRTVLLDKRVGMRDVGLRLIIIIIGDKVFHRIFGEELLELAAELRSQCFVVGEHQRRAVEGGNDVGHRERLARAGDASQHLFVQAVFKPGDKRPDRLGLISHRLIIRM